MKALLTIFALIEVAAGLTLVVAPSKLTTLLVGTQLDTPTALIVGRVAGIALLSFVIACWVARTDTLSPVARGLVAGMLLYNVGVVTLLVHADTGARPNWRLAVARNSYSRSTRSVVRCLRAEQRNEHEGRLTVGPMPGANKAPRGLRGDLH